MGIEELERLVAEGIQAGLKGAELRMWVDGERAKLKTQREAEYEARKEAQEKEIAILNRKIAFLENLVKRNAAEASPVVQMKKERSKLEEIGEADELRLPRPNTSESAPRKCIRDDVQEYSKIVPVKTHLRTEYPNFELHSKMLPQKVERTPHVSVSQHGDVSLPSDNTVKEPAAKGAAYTQTDTSLFPYKTEHEAFGSKCSAEQRDFVPVSKMRKRKRKTQKKKSRSLIKGSTSPNRRPVLQRRKHLRRRLTNHYFYKRKQLKPKASVQILREISSAGAQSQPWPRYMSFLRGEPTVKRHSTGRSPSRIQTSGPSRTRYKECSQLPRYQYVQLCRMQIFVTQKSASFWTKPRRLNLHGQLCWKYRRK